jgi:uracil-DNA glycosylase
MPKTVSETVGCNGCPMRQQHPENKFVPPEFPNPAHDLGRLVIAEAPGKKESECGRPLVGKSGKLFDDLLESAGIRRDGLTITNCLSCRPPKNVFPTDSKIVQHCKGAHLDPLLHGRKWTRVYLVGDKALQIVTGQMEGITKWRGCPLKLYSGVKAIALFHPSFLNRKNKEEPGDAPRRRERPHQEPRRIRRVT